MFSVSSNHPIFWISQERDLLEPGSTGSSILFGVEKTPPLFRFALILESMLETHLTAEQMTIHKEKPDAGSRRVCAEFAEREPLAIAGLVVLVEVSRTSERIVFERCLTDRGREAVRTLQTYQTWDMVRHCPAPIEESIKVVLGHKGSIRDTMNYPDRWAALEAAMHPRILEAVRTLQSLWALNLDDDIALASAGGA